MLENTDRGLYCAAGDFYVDPWAPVPRAVITHAHADHARPGSERYLGAAPGLPILRRRLPDATIDVVAFGEAVSVGGVTVSFHPAGHVLGSAQVRLEHRGEVWVVSGDYKRAPDPTCAGFEPVRCHTFVTEATFGLPIYRWPASDAVISRIFAWWEDCRSAARPAVLGVYALGKAQRVLAELSAHTDRPVWVHGAIGNLVAAYAEAGVTGMLPTRAVAEAPNGQRWGGELILGTPAALGSPWARRFRNAEQALASGWMCVRGNRRWKAYDRGFALSDHADWPALLRTVDDSGAERVLVTHGSNAAFARYLGETRPVDARPLATAFQGEGEL